MKIKSLLSFILIITFLLSGCVSKKKFMALDAEHQSIEEQLSNCKSQLLESQKKVQVVNRDLEEENKLSENVKANKDEIITELRGQIKDLKKQREKQFTQVGDLTVLSQAANDNINQTIKQLERKDDYIKYILAARTKADSLNLALSINLKNVLQKGIADEDVEIKVDKTVVYINLSDKMLYQSGSYNLTTKANAVLAKIAKIIKSKPELDLMVEGYTDNMPIKNSCIRDNWDLSVKRSSSVVKALQTQFGVDPNRLIAAGRGEYNTLADNSTAEGRSINRRTRIILLPKLDQFYDLLKPTY
ncbi:MAG: OmpA family protein [Chitinophagales bacterium]